MNKLTLEGWFAVAMVLVFAGASCWSRETAAASPGGTAGIYAGSITYYRFPGPVASNPRQIFGAVGNEGTGYFISLSPVSGEVWVFRRLAGSGEITSPKYEVPTEGHAVARGVQKWKIEIKSVAGSRSSRQLLGTFNRVDGYAALKLRQLPLSHRHISFASRSGAYEGFELNRDTRVEISLHADGRLDGTDVSGCRISGRLTLPGSIGVLDIRMTLAGPRVCGAAMTGVAFFDTRDRTDRFSGAGSYLYLIGASGDFSRGVVMVLKHLSP